MGLGKTLSVLALLCWHLDTLHDTTTGVSKRTTLLVTPKSSKNMTNNETYC